jgi:hypothetical protein
MPTTTTRILSMNTVLKTRAVALYLVYTTVLRYISRLRESAARGSESVNNGRNTTDGLAYNHPTRCLTSYGDVSVVWSASRQPQPAP